MPHFRLIVLQTPIWGQSWSLSCILNHYFRFILKESLNKRRCNIYPDGRETVEEELTSDGRFLTFNVYPVIAKCERLLIERCDKI